jgi:hypothetical protein
LRIQSGFKRKNLTLHLSSPFLDLSVQTPHQYFYFYRQHNPGIAASASLTRPPKYQNVYPFKTKDTVTEIL